MAKIEPEQLVAFLKTQPSYVTGIDAIQDRMHPASNETAAIRRPPKELLDAILGYLEERRVEVTFTTTTTTLETNDSLGGRYIWRMCAAGAGS